jgi:hypothetical protein
LVESDFPEFFNLFSSSWAASCFTSHRNPVIYENFLYQHLEISQNHLQIKSVNMGFLINEAISKNRARKSLQMFSITDQTKIRHLHNLFQNRSCNIYHTQGYFIYFNAYIQAFHCNII